MLIVNFKVISYQHLVVNHRKNGPKLWPLLLTMPYVGFISPINTTSKKEENNQISMIYIQYSQMNIQFDLKSFLQLVSNLVKIMVLMN